MTLDSASVAHISKFLGIHPNLWFLGFLLMSGVLYIIVLLVKNTDLTSAIAKSMVANIANHEAMASAISEIRAGQIISNAERKKQLELNGVQAEINNKNQKQFDNIDKTLTEIQFDLLSLTRFQRLTGDKK